MAGEVLWRVRGALGADVELAGRAAAPRRAPFPEDKWKTSEITRYLRLLIGLRSRRRLH